jgi:hypothetical protein
MPPRKGVDTRAPAGALPAAHRGRGELLGDVEAPSLKLQAREGFTPVELIVLNHYRR